ncbi:hypothetical protein ABER99_21445 [Paenibacillus glucanolyticus]|jgi:hypothetical protein|uniref:Uncharacterized protein n=1 Tax=Paenibacillus glucanolyticus TaxID=59843 RepID=A0A163G5B9_9BACL|nr:hypothetical protein [Paenibacillus glucanolyticus]KZS44739.1 hypothetical protein AWU65_01750 [Paenibacillus glucanolyticus]OMF64406.1 hypothetical protein BK142_31985 [Paenibacillus glucanolyticus]
MIAEKLLEKLEAYEQSAYDGGFGQDWLSDIGEGFKFYVQECIQQGKSVTIAGFVKYIDNMALKKVIYQDE